MADADGLPCYLEASGPRNRSIYSHLGYVETEQCAVSVENDEPGSEPYTEFFAMVRPANRARARET